jgi:hypothetical protein
MSLTSTPRFSFDLPAIFRHAVWLGQAVRAHLDDPDGTAEYRSEWTRFRDVLNPLGLPYGWNSQYAFARVHPSYRSPEYDQPYFGNAVALGHGLPPEHGPALSTLASAAVLVNSENPRPGGFDLLGSGAWLLWQALDTRQRAACRENMTAAVKLWGWPTDAAGELGPHTGQVYQVKQQLAFIAIDLDAWRVAGRGSLKETQNAAGRDFRARQAEVRELAASMPTVAPEHAPPALRRAYELVTTAVADALRFMNGLYRYRRAEGLLVEDYWRDVTPVYHTAEEAVRAFEAVELALRAAGAAAFPDATTGLWDFMVHTKFTAPARLKKQKKVGQNLVSRATTLLEQYLSVRPFGENPFERMRDELARACHPQPSPSDSSVPVWNRATRCLRYRNELIRSYGKKTAPKQEAILDAFQRAGWSESVETSMGRDEVEEAVRSLNKRIAKNTIRFHQDGTGKGVKWGLAISG